MIKYSDFFRSSGLSCLLLLLIIGACNDPTTIGGGIVDNDIIPVKVQEFDVTLKQNGASPVVTYADGSLNLINHAQCGVLQDDQFGRSEAGFSMQFLPFNFITALDTSKLVVDSVALVLYLDENSAYGPQEEMSIGITRLAEAIDGDEDYQSDHTFALGEIVVPAFTFTPDYTTIDTPDESGPAVRIPLPVEIGYEILKMDTATLNSFSLFSQTFRGFYVHPVGSYNQYAGFRPYISTIQFSATAIRVYYRENDTEDESLTYRAAASIGDNKSPVVQHYTYDYTGSAVEEVLNQSTNDILYVQGNGGVDVELEIDGLTGLGNVIVNKAELFIPFHDKALIYNDHPELLTLMMTRQELTGNQNLIPEFQENGVFNLTQIGRLDTVENVPGYAYNIPIQTQQMIDGTIFDDNIRLQSIFVPSSDIRRGAIGPATMGESSARSVIYGLKNLSEAIRLKVSYTEN